MPVQEFTFSQIGNLTAAIPALLGFTPERSLVFMFLKEDMDSPHHAIPVVARMDIHEFQRAPRGRSAERLARLGNAALVAIVDDRARSHDRTEHEALLRTVEAEFAAAGVTLVGAWATPAITPDSPWWSLTDDGTGTMPDPTTEPLTAHTVLQGRNISRSRADIEARFTLDAARSDAVAQHLRAAIDDNAAQFAAAVRANELDEFTAREVAEIMTRIERHDPAAGADPADAAYVAARLGNSETHYGLFRLCGSELADRAEAFWLDLTRLLPGQARAIPATLYGFSAYALREDGVSASIAFGIALDEDPECRLARLLSHTVECGVPPQIVRDKFGIVRPA
ncbi:DUF4192 domain-containing protein [Nocardia tengchongensis]|uniref:DUF4192 domain-containing protein n=1 Tax=Nocardia tengchongensis TaxID=2055889 RepID=UPI00361E66AA